MTTITNSTKVFIAGSRHLSRLNPNVRRRIDTIVDKGLTVIVGDANGVDKSVQRYLSSKRYVNVVVYCMEGNCRNNIGDWPTKGISAADPGRRDFAYYSTKDRAMAAEADYGLMLWDGQSRGTLTNIVHLVRMGKPVVVYIAPDRSFHTLRQPNQLAGVLGRFGLDALDKADRELRAFEIGPNTSRKVGSAALF